MSSVTLHVQLAYETAEHAKLVFEAFSQWPTMTVRKKRPDARRMRAIKCSMDWIGYQLPTIFELVFEQQTCVLEDAPTRVGNSVKLQFYCGRQAGSKVVEAFIDELTALPVTIKIISLDDFDDSIYSQTRKIRGSTSP
ncbi:hypothetical protein CW735_15660 [Alteromonas sp. MB-3u-76]|uniref:hypothetical protein n=1 Tax=Alteromonas sp. MB-3u-76 TaxID=2058133 RepID=UPI000C31A69F|nr:hypothetical protein [Alteromonas sp. MB-3u-76]AUC89447.1 hypothetical protein CW735_15660 [Alteromonas sp. MB-3u-76]